MKPEINSLLADFAERVALILADNFVGLYVVGSLATGDHDEQSDVDWLVVTQRELNEAELDAVGQLHRELHTATPPWGNRLEGSYFPLPILRDFSKPAADIWYLDNGADEMVRSTHDNALVVRWVLRERGIVVSGRPPHTLLDPIPHGAMADEIAAVMSGWGPDIMAEPDKWNNGFFQPFIVILYCRMLHARQFGRIASKPEAAAWAMATFDPPWPALIARSLARRPHQYEQFDVKVDSAEMALTVDFVRYAISTLSD